MSRANENLTPASRVCRGICGGNALNTFGLSHTRDLLPGPASSEEELLQLDCPVNMFVSLFMRAGRSTPLWGAPTLGR